MAWHAQATKHVDPAMTPLWMGLWERDRQGHPLQLRQRARRIRTAPRMVLEEVEGGGVHCVSVAMRWIRRKKTAGLTH